ncbi:hypothetical protein BaRGS_00015860 [Batillaria attramentaria]|uniref:Uncharacterized protein n=1 Tax=Batillaria attramentaria TaxID=370345 RepID=A0ABD0L0V0_9CAEN
MAEASEQDDTRSPLELVKKFYTLQEERVEGYQFLESGFSAYLAGGPHYNFELYRSLVNEITQSFKCISEEIISIERCLRSVHQITGVADCIAKIQEAEKEKLDFTVQLQIDRQQATDNPEDECKRQQVSDLKEKLQQTTQKINEQMESFKYESEDLYTDGEER